MKLFPLALLALVAALSLAGCNPSETTTAIQDALNAACPIVSTLQSYASLLSSTEAAALQVAANACPPNPAPTTFSAVAVDLVDDVPVLLAALTRLEPASAPTAKAQVRTLLVAHAAALRSAVPAAKLNKLRAAAR